MNRKIHLSVIIITKNEADRISSCIQNVLWADEILVIDNGSTDNTVAVAKQYHVRVFHEKAKNFARLRNIGARQARGTWLLYIDADETVTEKLKKEILSVIGNPDASSAYILPRQNIYLGRPWPFHDGMIRLMKKESLLSWEGILHEHAIVRGAVRSLRNSCIHNTHRTLSDMVTKTNEWSQYEASLRFRAGHPRISWWRILRVMMTSFGDSFITQGGWRAGSIGWIESIYQSFSIFITYAKLWEMQKKRV